MLDALAALLLSGEGFGVGVRGKCLGVTGYGTRGSFYFCAALCFFSPQSPNLAIARVYYPTRKTPNPKPTNPQTQELLTRGDFVDVLTLTPHPSPLNPQPSTCGDFVDALKHATRFSELNKVAPRATCKILLGLGFRV